MRSVLLVLVIVALGCADSSTPSAPVAPKPMGKGGSGAPPPKRDGGLADASDEDLLFPKVQVLAPVPASDPNGADILTDTTVKVTCNIKASLVKGSREINKGTVRIKAESLVNPMKHVTGVVTATGSEDFEAELALDDFPNGGVRFSCEADDLGMPPRTTIETVDSLLDLGPIVRILEPGDESIHALKSPVAVRFEVLSSPIGNGDTGAEIASIDFRVLDQEFEYEEDPDTAGRYTVNIPFFDTTIFQMAPTNADISVTAYNSRKPNAVERRASVNVMLDSVGPTISLVKPMRQEIVRGQIQLVLTISDPSGVNNAKVNGRINSDSFTIEPKDWEISGDTYTAQFDTRAMVFKDLPDITIDVTAEDMVGNVSMIDFQLRLDNVPPTLSIDPPFMREWYLEGTTVRRCSAAFDPLGNAVNDGQNVQRAVMFRAMVNDEGNRIMGGNAEYPAGVDEDSMRLFARHDDGIPLLIDTDADGKCDDINSEALSEEDKPAIITLSPLEVRGTAPYLIGTLFNETTHNAEGWGCSEGTAAEPPAIFCSSGMSRTVHQTIEGAPRSIYSLSPRGGEGVACNGNTWSLEPIVGEGWTCVAAMVTDNIGNRGISRPIRVCIDDEVDPPPACLNDKVANPPPSCVDSCTLPNDFEVNRMLRRQ